MCRNKCGLLHKKIAIFSCIPLVIITVIILFSLTVQAEDRYEGTFNPGDSLRFQSPFKDNDKSKIQSDPKKNPYQEKLMPILVDPRNTIGFESETLGVYGRILEEEAWIIYSISATEWSWNVRRPGIYASKCLVGTITSNVDVTIHFQGFEDLSSSNSPPKNLETYYSATVLDLPINQLVWHRASDFNKPECDLFIAKNPMIQTPWSLWNKISVANGISADEYNDDAYITFLMQNTETWTDPKIMIGR
jgi:hypothetical protein